MRMSTRLLGVGALALSAPAAALRNAIYYDAYHIPTSAPPAEAISTISHVIIAFANTTNFNTGTPFNTTINITQIHDWFGDKVKLGVALGGWGDTQGFSDGCKTEESRATFAKNVNQMVTDFDLSLVDIDWEYPGGNGNDYKQTPNSDKVDEIAAFPLFLQAVKDAIGCEVELSIAAPGLARDMIAYTPQTAPAIFAAVDFVNIMAYDLMNRRDDATKHHTDVEGSKAAVQRYLDLGLDPAKANLGFPFYAKYFATEKGHACSAAELPVGCPIQLAELPDGTDAGTSGALTWEASTLAPAPAAPQNPQNTTDGSCGLGAGSTCAYYASGTCCSQYGFCGATDAHCGTGCQSDYSAAGACAGAAIADSWKKAAQGGQLDDAAGGQWFWDADAEIFWTWDTVDMIGRKFTDIVKPLGLGGVMAWSLAEDDYNWAHLTAINQGVESSSPGTNTTATIGARAGGRVGLKNCRPYE